MTDRTITRRDARLGKWAYALPLVVGLVMCLAVWPAQVDRLADDEVRESGRAFALAHGDVDFWVSWSESVHPPLVPAVAAGALAVLPPNLAVRVPALLAGFLAIICVVALGRRLGRPEVGLVAGLLVAASPIWWAYASSISLDVPLACCAALAVLASVGPRPSLLLAVLAALVAALTKRHGIAVLLIAMLLAHLAQSGRRRGTRLLAISGAAALAAASTWKYSMTGQELFGSRTRLDELVGASPLFVVLALVCAAGLAVTYRCTEPARRRILLPLWLFCVPFVVTPMIAAHPAPRYFLPVLPAGAALLAASIWLSGRTGAATHPRVRWALSVGLLACWVGFQVADLHMNYWPRSRGHRDAVAWLRTHVPPSAPLISPDGPFLETTARLYDIPLGPVTEVDRRTCAGLELALGTAPTGAFVVLPLYRDLGWPADFEQHAASMGLELRALVRRAVASDGHDVPWHDAAVESLGPPAGTPSLAILAAVRRPDTRALRSASETMTIARFDDPSAFAGWRNDGVGLEAVPGGGTALEFPRANARLFGGALIDSDLLESADWHHHRGVELQVRATDEALELLQLHVGLRDDTVSATLHGLRRAPTDDGWTRLIIDFGAHSIWQRSRINWLIMSARSDMPASAPPVRIELRALALLPRSAFEPGSE